MRPSSKANAKPVEPKKSCLSEIQRLQKERDERRKNMEQIKMERAAEEQRNRESGTPGDVDFQRMIRQYRENSAPPERPHLKSNDKICICVRKRPISSKEVKRQDHDSVTCANPIVAVHDCKLKVDGISKYLDNNLFQMDHTFHEENTTEEIYDAAIEPLIDFVLDGGRATVFAYGQTGSGKTYTMQGIQNYVCDDLFIGLDRKNLNYQVSVSFFEIYGGRCQDLLNERQRLNVREDGNGDVVVSDLLEVSADSGNTLRETIESGFNNRTTHATESNDVSSRSHAICQIALRNEKGREMGRFSLIDLAGSERGADTKSHNRQRRMEGAEINKSLLALKECIRAIDGNSTHIPYRASKLTLVLKDSFTRQKSRTVMIAAVSPAASSADHTINTLRYADRIKERVVGGNYPTSGGGVPISQKDKDNTPSAGGGGGGALNKSPSTGGVVTPSRQSPVTVPSTTNNTNTNNANNTNNGNNNIRNASPNVNGRVSPSPGIASNAGAKNSSNSGNNNGSSNESKLPPSIRRETPSKDRGDKSTSTTTTTTTNNNNNNGSNNGSNSSRQSNNKNIAEDKRSGNNKNNQNDIKKSGGNRYVNDDEDSIDGIILPSKYKKNSPFSSVENEEDVEDEELNELEYSMEEEFQRTVQNLFDEEEELLNLHMNIIQENAELLTEEGRLLQQMQTDDYDIDVYAMKLDTILLRKQELISTLREKLSHFRKQLVREETISKRVRDGF